MTGDDRDELTRLRGDLRRVMESSEHAERSVAELASIVNLLLQLLQLQGTLGEGHLRMLDRLRGQVERVIEPPIRIDRTTVDKYAQPGTGTEIACASIIELCHGRCCAYDIALSEQDLAEGKLSWRIEQPYWLPRTTDGYCTYQDRTSGGCGVYAHRPGMCRTYDCRTDTRVWLDFEQRIPAPLAPGLTQIRKRG